MHTYIIAFTKTQEHIHPLQRFCCWLQWEMHFICVKVWTDDRQEINYSFLLLDHLSSAHANASPLGMPQHRKPMGPLRNRLKCFQSASKTNVLSFFNMAEFQHPHIIVFLPNRYNNFFVAVVPSMNFILLATRFLQNACLKADSIVHVTVYYKVIS